MVIIDHQALEKETLINLLSEIVLREGTDYGTQMMSHDAKVSALCNKLNAGTATLIFLEEENYCDVISSRDLPAEPAKK